MKKNKTNSITSRMPVEDFTRRVPFRDARLVIISSEGRNTEPTYFSLFTDRNGVFFNPRVRQVHCIENQTNDSAPDYVLGRMLQFIKANDIKGNDECWLVLDVDEWDEKGKLRPVIDESKQNGINLAISNPKFEVWLLCHFVDQLPSLDELTDAIRSSVGTSKHLADISRYTDFVSRAVQTAKTADLNPHSDIPDVVGSRVYRLIESILPRP